MPAYTNISNALVAVGAKPFASTVQALRDNPIAIAEGEAGAPRIQRAAIVDGAINRVKLQTATASQSYSFGSGGGSLIVTLNPYSFIPANTGSSGSFAFANSGSVDAPRVVVSHGSSASGSIVWRYIDA